MRHSWAPVEAVRRDVSGVRALQANGAAIHRVARGWTMMTCIVCGVVKEIKPDKRGSVRLPRGWHRVGEASYCAGCWGKRYVLRAITMPVAGPMGDGDGMDWVELRKRLAEAWQQSTGMGNWAVTELAKADVVRNPGMEKLKPMEGVYLYPGARAQYPGMTSSSVVSLLHAVEGKYRKTRLEVIWRNSASLPRFKYPMPYPVNAQNWSARYLSEKERVPLVEMRLGESRVCLRLAARKGMRRQLAAFGEIVEGKAVPCELAIYRQRASEGDHRVGMSGKEPAGGAGVRYRGMVKMVAWLLKKEGVKGDGGTLELRTEKDRFWVGKIEGKEGEWVLNADHVLRWVVSHRRRLGRMSEDTKFEKRWPSRKRVQMQDYRDKFLGKHHDRLNSWIHQASASVVGYAVRNRVGRVQYDDSERLTSEFPWHMLTERLKYKCEDNGIEFAEVGKGDVEGKGAETAVEGES